MSDSFEFPIYLLPTGDDGSAYRLQDKPGGEMQRTHIVQDGSELTAQADLFSVIHGKVSPQGGTATLIVIDFRFTGSESHRKRFRKATIDIKFALHDDTVGGELDPEVIKIAPYGTFFMDPSTKQEDTTVHANMSAGTGAPVALGIEAGWEQTKSVVKEERATLSGSCRIEGRNYGSYNAARWKIHENKQQKHGIPSFLRTAILLAPKSTKRFRAFVAVDTHVDMLYSAGQRIKRFLGGVVVDPVYFDEEGKRKPMGPKLANVDIANLAECNLKELSAVQVLPSSL
ncbi:hypothetical protein H2201_008763 [Coniosporium apollinis]|uniref:Uncharacterized protein n=1 Tax=Coniosporium apollinis TaxID=61459 RepID=A0ABQ9NI22_9PEZI|nr:hypothetical protein H2201_008763 [Coniosporium apollinis]